MGVASSDMIEMIIKRYKNEIESAKNEIKKLKGKNTNKCYNLIFRLMNGKTWIINCFENTPLFHVFLLLIDKAKDNEYSNIDKLKIYYNSVNITENFKENSNKTVLDLQFSIDNPVIFINS